MLILRPELIADVRGDARFDAARAERDQRQPDRASPTRVSFTATAQGVPKQ